MALSEALYSITRVRLAVQALAATSRPQASSRLVSALQGVFAAMSKAPHIDQIVHPAPLFFWLLVPNKHVVALGSCRATKA